LARNAGVEGFCYYHYWFAGRRVIERPFNEVLVSGKPDFPFCLCWANQTWSGIWHGNPNKLLIEQTYPGSGDEKAHFMALLPAFRDRRYIKVNGRLLTIFRPYEIPNCKGFTNHWQQLAIEHHLPGFHFVAHSSSLDKESNDHKAAGFQAAVIVNNLKARRVGPESVLKRHWQQSATLSSRRQCTLARVIALRNYGWYLWNRARGKLGRFNHITLYEDAMRFFLDGVAPGDYPCVVPNWDNTARSGRRGFVLHRSTPELFEQHLREAAALVRDRPADERIIYVKSWNEWAEGNYLEPDRRFGLGYLDAVRSVTEDAKAAYDG
jgi:hypothetical protein